MKFGSKSTGTEGKKGERRMRDFIIVILIFLVGAGVVMLLQGRIDWLEIQYESLKRQIEKLREKEEEEKEQ